MKKLLALMAAFGMLVAVVAFAADETTPADAQQKAASTTTTTTTTATTAKKAKTKHGHKHAPKTEAAPEATK